jgi:hypothetical protein
MRLLRHWCDGTENGRGAGRAVRPPPPPRPTQHRGMMGSSGRARQRRTARHPASLPPCAPFAATPFRFSVQLGDRRPRIDNRARLRGISHRPTQTWFKFGCGLCRRETDRCVHPRTPPSTRGTACHRSRRRFVSCTGSVTYMGKGCDAASASAPPSRTPSI